MNRLRVRIGENIREYVIRPPDEGAMLYVEDEIDTVLATVFNVGPYRLEYVGEFAWDVYVSGQKVGHAKAWRECGKHKEPEGHTLWGWFLIILLAYWTLL